MSNVENTERLTDEFFAFVTDPSPRRNQRPIVDQMQDFNPDIIPVLESMILDGVDERQDVEEYVQEVFG